MNNKLINKTVLPQIYRKLRPHAKRDEGDIDFTHTCHYLDATTIAELVLTWYNLHLETYNIEEDKVIDFLTDASALINNDNPPNTLQFLKWLRHIRNGVDIELLDRERTFIDTEAAAVDYLDSIINAVLWEVVSTHSRYEAASDDLLS
ncbi:hypothetical protein EGT74_06600 [Chitinophaga lutea]|uniref:Uncharacterized protein n=1 Tax=Chitinophaga lutea TaxID=2488634 RepID=A0A3N4PZ89_9BACT|nr:hypothetical protein [Chitinophaga lutea]RPE13196.1 hypothetical protein EGT74_06600 [Chitinophaga lutea]